MIKKLNHDSGGRTSLNIPRSIRRKQLEQRKAKKTHQEKRREREREREGSRSKKAEGVDDNGDGNGIDKRGSSRRQVTMSKLRT
jgi:hypothetical protein